MGCWRARGEHGSASATVLRLGGSLCAESRRQCRAVGVVVAFVLVGAKCRRSMKKPKLDDIYVPRPSSQGGARYSLPSGSQAAKSGPSARSPASPYIRPPSLSLPLSLPLYHHDIATPSLPSHLQSTRRRRMHHSLSQRFSGGTRLSGALMQGATIRRGIVPAAVAGCLGWSCAGLVAGPEQVVRAGGPEQHGV